jgi:hypothetical protein
MTTDPFTVDLDLVMALGRRALEASMRAIPAIYRNCSMPSMALEVEFSPTVFREALDLVEFAFRYDQIMYCFELADRGQFEVRYDPLEERTHFQYASADESARDTLLRSHERDANFEFAAEADKAVILTLAQKARQELEPTIFFDQPHAISYRLTPALLSVAKQWAVVLAKGRRWEFPENLVIGNLTMGDVRKFWSAIAVLVNLNEMAHMIVANGQSKMRPPATVAGVRSREEWCTLIQEIAGIGAGAASELLWWYTFDPKVSEATAPIQPLLPISAKNLILITNLVNNSNVERNLQKLLNRHPQLRSFYAALKNAKERIALTYLAALFPAADFAVKPTVVIKDLTDADLVVLERSSGFVLVIQHKWLIAPETVSESSSNDDQLREGVRQAVTARDVFRGDHTLLRRVLELVADQPINKVEAVVICRGAEQTGFLGEQPVPLALERALEELWKESSLSLAKLWEKLSSRPDHERAADRYGDTAATLSFGELEFSFPALSLEVQV